MSTLRPLYSTFVEPQHLTQGNTAQSGIRYSSLKSHDQPVRVFMDFAFFRDKIRCLAKGAERDMDDVVRAIEMNKRWNKAVVAATAAAEKQQQQEGEDNQNGNSGNGEKSEAPAAVNLQGTTFRVVFELDIDRCPRTCHNFLRLCTDGGLAEIVTGRDAPTASKIKEAAVYKGTYMHKLLPGFIVAGGDLVSSSGLNNYKSALGTGTWFRDESLQIPHDRAGLLSMVNNGPNSNGSMFFVTLNDGSTQKLDSRHCCFGRAVEGFDEFNAELQKCLISGTGVLASSVVIADCGVL